MSTLLLRVLVKAIFEQSGDQTGSVSLPDRFVRLVWFAPFASITHTSALPLRLDENRMRPHGEARLYVAVTLRAWSIVTTQVPVPEQPAPLQPANVEPVSAVAVSVTTCGWA